MSFQLFSPSPIVSFLYFLLVVSVNIQLCLGNAEMLERCKTPFRCGHITAGYPFWRDGLPDYCRPIPGFKLNCENEKTALMIDEVEYVVLSINEKSQVLIIANKDIHDNGICHFNISNLPNTSFSEHFEVVKGYKMLTLRCGFKNGEGEFTCSSECIIDKDHDTITIGGLGLPRYVSVNVTLPAEFSVGAFIKSVLDLEEALKHGFEVKWKVNDSVFCDKCLKSSGNCSYSLFPHPSCHCLGQPFNPDTEPPCSTPPAAAPPGDHPADDYRFTNCSLPVYCGNQSIDIYYPFWGVNRADYCGLSGFQMECQDGILKIKMLSNMFRILGINQTTQTLKVARDDFWYSICPTNLFNTTIDFTRFSYAPGQRNLTLYYGCPIRPDPFIVSSDCAVNGTSMNVLYVPQSSPVDPLIGSCYCSVIVPVLETTAQELDQGRNFVNDTLDEGFEVQWILGNDQCNTCVNSGGVCGYNSTESQFVCFCRDQPNAIECLSSPGPPGASSRKRSFFNNQWKIAVGIIASMLGMGTIITILSMVGMGRLWKKKTKDDQSIEAFIRNCGSHAPRRYSFSDVRNITKSFNEKLGQGGYGNVYKGKLPDGRLVAVKILKASKGNGEEFINEVASMSRTSHVNIVSLLGFCCEKNKRALIYEFMCNGSLDKFTCDTESSTTNCNLEWKTLYQIAIGIARGLEYLHKGCNIRIVHFDIKPHNILLNEDFCPKISDFGLAKQSNQKDSIMSMLHTRGTVGYIAPEMFYRKFGGVSYKSDVYSYGMMILEIVGARKNIGIRVSQTSEIYFPDSIYNLLELGKDFDLPSVVTEEEKETAKRMILVSLWCIQTNPSDRPSMTKVVEMLEGRPEKLQIPPKPYWSSPTRSPELSLLASLSTQLASACEML